MRIFKQYNEIPSGFHCIVRWLPPQFRKDIMRYASAGESVVDRVPYNKKKVYLESVGEICSGKKFCKSVNNKNKTSMNDFFIEKLLHSEICEVAGMLTDAFKTNPAYSIVFKKKNRQQEGLFWLFKASLLLNNYRQTLTRVVKEKDTGKIIGTYTLIPPQGVKKEISVYAKIGIVGFITKYGLKSLIRMLRLDDCNKLTLQKSIKTSAYYYLSMVVISEDYRGKGIGSYAMKYAIQELIASNSACNIIGLTTQLPENVIFYSRLGFDLLDEGDINFKGDRYYNYNMKLTVYK